MQVIKPMELNRFETICDAGAELHAELVKVLTKYGLSYDSDAASVMLIAVGGVFASAGQMDPGTFIDHASATRGFWQDAPGTESGVEFAPPHRDPSFVPVARDSSNEN